MAMSAAERQRRRREKLRKEGKYEEYKIKNKEQSKKHRRKIKEKLKKLQFKERIVIINKKRQEVKLRVAKHRLLKKLEKKKFEDNASTDTIGSNKPAYSSAQALGKAVHRARRALPSSPHRRTAVVKKLFVDTGASTSSTDAFLQEKHRNAINGEIVESVKCFYSQDDISRMAPGRKDVITVSALHGDGKSKLQVRHMLYTISEAYQLYKQQNPEINIGKSKFAELRPPHVLLSSKLPHNVCLCKYHSNFILAIDSLHNVHDQVIPKYTHEFPEKLICENPTEHCWLNQCNTCNNGKGLRKLIGNFEERAVKWCTWKNDNNGERIHKVLEEGTTMELVDFISSITPQFLEHCYIKRKQAENYRILRDEAEKSLFAYKAMIQVDFAENYTCVSQDEIQSAHWQQSQISLFTAAVWHSGKMKPYVLASDNLTHSKDTVAAYIDILLEILPGNIKDVFIWSDGPASQFKNRYVIHVLPKLCSKYDMSIQWNFFATSHGKGPVDGIGGAVKRKVWNAVKQRKCVVTCASDFAEAYNSYGCQNVKILSVTSTDIEKRNSELQMENIIKNATSVVGISRTHCVKANSDTFTTSFLTSQNIQESSSDAAIKVGDWYFVEYDGKCYPGEIREIRNSEFLVSTMEPAGRNWKWPSVPDEVFYTRSQLIRQIKVPIVVNSRGHFKFE